MRLKLRIVLSCMFICTFMQFGIVANAKDYNITSADFDVILNEDGSADVTEEWTLEFTSGEFSRFYKEIYKDVTELEKYDDITFHGFWINDMPCEETFNTSTRDDYTYYLSEERELYDLQWYYNVEDESVVYRVEYTMSDVVKETDNNVALFCYRYLGEEFDKRVDNLSVKITAPGDCDIELRYGNASVEKGNDYIVLFENCVRGMIKYNIAMPAEFFRGLTYIPLEDIKEMENKINTQNNDMNNNTSNRNHFSIFSILSPLFKLAFVAGIICFFRKGSFTSNYEKTLKENPNYFEQLIIKYQGVSPIKFMIAKAKNPLPFQFF